MIQEQDIRVTTKGQGVVLGEHEGLNERLRYIKPGALVLRADGLDNLFEFMAEHMPTPKQSGSSSTPGGKWGGFYFFPTYEEAWGVFRNKPESVVKFDPSELRVTDESEAGRTVDYDVVGDYIDMGRYLEGVPESWGSMRNGNARNRRANLYIDLSYSGSTDNKRIIHRGERILRLVDALEAGGVRVQLTGVESTQCGHVEVVLKQHSEPLTITDLAVVSHSDFLRRIMFRVVEYSKTWQGGYGNSTLLENSIDGFPELIRPENNDEISIFIAGNLTSVDDYFDKLERLLEWELSKPVPEVDAIRVTGWGISFSPNGYRAEQEILREGKEVIGYER